MKLPRTIASSRRRAGILLIECVVYIGVFAILLGIGTAVFYFCWDHSKAMIRASDDITSALHVGERWRADVRNATGKISLETNDAGEVLRIPEAKDEVVYHFENGGVRREIPGRHISQLLLSRVKTSQVKTETRGGVKAWRWELELAPRHKEAILPLRFTFEAAETKP